MSVLPILKYPHPLLKRVCRTVDRLDEEIGRLMSDLEDTMRNGPGSVGVAAPQIGVSLRACVIDVSANRYGRDCNHGLLKMVNPVIVQREGSSIMREGCMSVPDYTGDVERSSGITVEYTDADTGSEVRIQTAGFEAVAIQHELDHLDGILFLDRVVCIKTGLFRRKNYR